jgi:hypothetical protein
MSEVEQDVLVLDASVSIFDPSANRVLRLLKQLKKEGTHQPMDKVSTMSEHSYCTVRVI